MSGGVLFKGLGVQKDTQTPCWLRPCVRDSVALPILNIDVAAFTDEEADDGAPALDGSDLESTDTITVLPVIICT